MIYVTQPRIKYLTFLKNKNYNFFDPHPPTKDGPHKEVYVGGVQGNVTVFKDEYGAVFEANTEEDHKILKKIKEEYNCLVFDSNCEMWKG